MNRIKKHLKEKEIKEGDRVSWSYIHSLNSKSSTIRKKEGVFIRPVRSEKIDGGSRTTSYEYSLVHFEGNKRPSRVKTKELVKL